MVGWVIVRRGTATVCSALGIMGSILVDTTAELAEKRLQDIPPDRRGNYKVLPVRVEALAECVWTDSSSE